MDKRKFKKALHRLKHLPLNTYLFLYLWNKLRHFRYKLIKSTKVAYPSTIMLELTNHCNLACTTCPREYRYGKEMNKGSMKIESAKAIIDELWPYLDSIGLTGMGETFLYKELEEIVDYIKQKNKGIIISISTNAVLSGFTEKASRLIGKIDTIQISIDGLNDTYNNIRIKSDFQTLSENIEELAKLCCNEKTDLMLNMVVTKENYLQMPELIEYASAKGINYMDFTLFNLASVTDIPLSYYQFYQSDEFLKVLEKLDAAINKHKNVTVTNRNFKTDNGFQKCPFPWTHFYITWDGYITPCCAKPFPKETHFGNVFGNKVIDILNSKAFVEWRKLWYHNISPAFCEKCNFIDVEPIKAGSQK